MSPFQIMALTVIGFLIVLTVTAAAMRSVSRREWMVAMLVWLSAASAIIYPELTAKLARAVGVTRGVDLVLYSALLVMMVGFMAVYVRLRRLQHDVTLLVRSIAIRDAQENTD